MDNKPSCDSDKDFGRLLHPYEVVPSYSSCVLSNDVLWIDGGFFLAGNHIVVDDGYDCLAPEYNSPFVHLKFHKVLIGNNIHYLCKGCFNGCRELKKIVLSESVEVIEYPIANDTAIEYFNDDDLLFLGTENNPRHALMGCVDDYKSDRIIVPASTKVVAENIRWPQQVKEIHFSDGRIVKVNENANEDAMETGDELPF